MASSPTRACVITICILTTFLFSTVGKERTEGPFLLEQRVGWETGSLGVPWPGLGLQDPSPIVRRHSC